MATSAELNLLTVKELGKIAKELGIPGWHEMRKEDLVRSLVQKSRSKQGGETIRVRLSMRSKTVGKQNTAVSVQKSKAVSSKLSAKEKPKTTEKKSSLPKPVQAGNERKKEALRKRDGHKIPTGKTSPELSELHIRRKGRSEIALRAVAEQNDRLVLLVRDPFWLHAFWELNTKTLKRAEVALGHFWHSAIPVLRLFRVYSDGSSHPKRHAIRDIRIHGGVKNWYLDVDNPPSKFQVELGYLSQEQKFYSLISSNTVETPQRQIVDELDHLDGNWRGVADDLGRIYKLSGGDANNHELKKVFEEQLRRPMSGAMLSRYRASRHGTAGEKTRRNFSFSVDADVIIHGKTDPSVQVAIRNEPIQIAPDGTFFVRFSLPEKRHVFPIEAEGSDGVEMQRVVLTVERNTRVLETLFQEPTEED